MELPEIKNVPLEVLEIKRHLKGLLFQKYLALRVEE